jgi:hypothetical protein
METMYLEQERENDIISDMDNFLKPETRALYLAR